MENLFNIPELIAAYGYLGIFIIVFLESGIFFPLPGDSLLFTAGLLAVTSGLNIFLLVPLIFFATLLGGVAGYEVGVHIAKLHNFSFFKKFLKQEYIDKAHRFFEKHGRMAVTFSRFVPVIRTFVPIAAGVARMHYGLFMKYSLMGSFLWSFIVTLSGYFLGHIFPQIKDYLWVILILIVITSIMPIIFEWRRERKMRH